MDPRLAIAADADELASRLAREIATAIAAAPGRFALSLCGGSTPKRLYALLAQPQLGIDWQKLHLFFGDERFVPFDDEDSNYKMVKDAMIAHVPIPAAQVHRVPVDAATPTAAAALYAAHLQDFYGASQLASQRPLFDLSLLGLGADGHTASLFPGSPSLNEDRAWVVADLVSKNEPRVSLTFPVIESSRRIVFLVAGAEKRESLARVLAGDKSLPATRLAGAANVAFCIDRAAAPAI